MPSLSEDDGKSDSEGGDLDKQMGDLNGEEADKLDERLWGDDDEEEDEEEEDSKTEETGPGMDEVIKRFPPSSNPQVEMRHSSHQLPLPVIYYSSFSVFVFLLSFIPFFSFFPLPSFVLDCIQIRKNGLMSAFPCVTERKLRRLSANAPILLLTTELLQLFA